jgi:hypothetical protein
LFVRDVSLDTVFAQVPDLLRQHPHFLASVSSARAGEFRARLRGKAEVFSIMLTVLCFHIPSQEKPAN